MQQLRGRNLSHIGCTLGLIVGLFLGLLLAVVALRVAPSVTLAVGIFAAVTAVLGVAGFYLGAVATRHFASRG